MSMETICEQQRGRESSTASSPWAPEGTGPKSENPLRPEDQSEDQSCFHAGCALSFTEGAPNLESGDPGSETVKQEHRQTPRDGS